MTLSINEQNHTMHSLMYSAENEQAQRAGWTSSEKVRTQSFASFMAENNIDEIDFVKFDVEGADELILYSEGFTSIAHKIKAIEIEFHHPTFPQLVDHLVRLGFTARRYPSSAVVVLFTR
jgi:FkbM family methyltransferase